MNKSQAVCCSSRREQTNFIPDNLLLLFEMASVICSVGKYSSPPRSVSTNKRVCNQSELDGKFKNDIQFVKSGKYSS
jgi:hypothetical protein